MRKITGKALAAVLAMALLTSSFSGTFAFAASSERAGSVSFSGDDEVTLVKDTEDPNEYKFDLEGLIGTMTLTTTDKAEKDVAVDSEDLSFRHAKGARPELRATRPAPRPSWSMAKRPSPATTATSP